MSNDYYTPTGIPATGQPGTSFPVRGEYGLIAAGFAKLPPLSGNSGKSVIVNPGETGLTVTIGVVGEFISSSIASGAAVTLTTATTADVTSVALTAGDWDIWGNLIFLPGGSTTFTTLVGGLSNNTSATLPTAPAAGGYAGLTLAFPTGAAQAFSLGMIRVLATGARTIYLVANATFAVSTMKAYGFLGARRRV